jgi:hypothetical protein
MRDLIVDFRDLFNLFIKTITYFVSHLLTHIQIYFPKTQAFYMPTYNDIVRFVESEKL